MLNISSCFAGNRDVLLRTRLDLVPVGKGLERGGDEGRKKKKRVRLFVLQVIFFFPLIDDRVSRAAYCLSLMNNVNQCEKEKKRREQRRLQARRINVKTKTKNVCPHI